jgi:hypothetical protein
MQFDPDNPATWRPYFRPPIIAHDVGRSRDRSTAVVGGNCPANPGLVDIVELEELPVGLYGSPRASALAQVDRRYNNNALIVVDVSNDPSYAEVMLRTFGRRVIGTQIARSGDGMSAEQRPVGQGAILVYTVGRTYLLELLHSHLQSGTVRFVAGAQSLRAYQQLNELETEMRDTGIFYTCPPGRHDDLGISCAMLVWAARHPHLSYWAGNAAPRRPRPSRQAEMWRGATTG